MSKKPERTREPVDAVYGTVNAPDGTITLHYDFEQDAIELVSADPESTKTERRYERESGKPKIVSSIPSHGSSPFTAQRALFAYERVVAIDTNHWTIDDKRCAVCFSYYVPTYSFAQVQFQESADRPGKDRIVSRSEGDSRDAVDQLSSDCLVVSPDTENVQAFDLVGERTVPEKLCSLTRPQRLWLQK